jgi:AraC family transcriptional regulator
MLVTSMSGPTASRLDFAELTYQVGYAQPMHQHEYANISVVLTGVIRERVESRMHEGLAGHVVFKPAGIWHGNGFGSKGARVFRIELHGGDSNDPLGTDRLRDYAWMQGGPALALMLRARWEHGTTRPAGRLDLECLALEILSLLPGNRVPAGTGHDSDTRGPEPRWFRSLRDLLHDRFDEPLRVAALAREVGVHPVHLARVFRRRYRGTLGDYVRWLRLGRSIERMRQNDRSLADIALETGFFDQAHFSRTFRSGLGRSPAAYRRDL